MEVFTLPQPKEFIVCLRGTCVGDADAAQLTDVLIEAAKPRYQVLWLDCEQLQHIDYRGLRVLLRVLPSLEATGTRLLLCGLQPPVQSRFEETGMASLFTLLPASAYAGPRPSRA